MQTTTESLLIQKTRELCQNLLADEEFQSIRSRIDSFMGDDDAKNLYQSVMEKGESLQHKQQMAAPLADAELADFESHRERLLKNPVAQGFIDAQQEMHKLQETVGQYLAKTCELGRVPSSDDFPADGGCGASCGCSH